MKFLIATTGKIKEDFIKKGVQEYSRRINHYTELSFLPIKEERIGKGASEPLIIQKEGERILTKAPRDGLWVALERHGQEMNSLQHFDFINTQAKKGIKKLIYLIGGPLGLSKEVLGQSSQILCLSRMTLTHELSALFLIEQIYRYVNFMSGEKYHK
jgi:23S rRNA (pseudouridine1915-N3)-methyltransferase